MRGWWRILRRATKRFESFHGGRPEGRPSLFCPKFVMSTRSLRQFTKHRIIEAMKQVVHAACPHDCPDACGVLITVEDGRATRIQGDPEHPVTRGFLCAKVAKYLDRVYSPERVLYPMRRVVAKGPAAYAGGGARATWERSFAPLGRPGPAVPTQAFERISWDEALDEIAHRLRRIVAEHGCESILPYSYGGSLGALNSASMDRRFFHRLGASQLERSICSSCEAPRRWKKR